MSVEELLQQTTRGKKKNSSGRFSDASQRLGAGRLEQAKITEFDEAGRSAVSDSQ
jgi:hypothetical protein